MEVRCASCSKLFRVPDDKIQGAGVKFGCSRCGSAVKITREDFERYRESQGPAPAGAAVSSRPAPSEAPVVKKTEQAAVSRATAPSHEAAQNDIFDLSEPAAAAAAMGAFGLSEPAAAANPMDAFDLSEPSAAAAAMGALDLGEPAAAATPMDAFDLGEPAVPAADPTDSFGLTEPAGAVAAIQERKEEKPAVAQTMEHADPSPAFVAAGSEPKPKPEQPPAVKVQPKPVPARRVKSETDAPAEKKQEPVRPQSPPPQPAVVPSTIPAAEPRAASKGKETVLPQPRTTSGIGKKIAILFVFVLIIGSLGAGAWFYLEPFSQTATDTVQHLTSPDGLQVKNPVGSIEPESQDLIVSGMVENATDKPKPAWLVLVEVYDAQGAVLVKARLVNGKQLYTRRDYEIMAKRGENVQDIKMKQLQNPGVPVPALGSVNFDVRVMEPPVGIASFNATLQPFDPVQLLKELAEEQK